MKPTTAEFGAYFGRYIDLVSEQDLNLALAKSLQSGLPFWSSIPEEDAAYRYAEGKWSVKQVLLHIIDTERIFCYRALSFARGETQSIPGYDENAYADNSDTELRTMQSLVEEYKSVRNSTLTLFKNLSAEAMIAIGNANDMPMSARAAGFIIVGHEMHHMNVVKERYLKKT